MDDRPACKSELDIERGLQAVLDEIGWIEGGDETLPRLVEIFRKASTEKAG